MRAILLSAFLLVDSLVVSAKSMCTQDELRSAICWALCRNDGYDSGSYVRQTKKCACSVHREFLDLTRVILKVNPRLADEVPVVRDSDYGDY